MDDQAMIDTLRLMSATHDGDKPRVRWTWDETRKGRGRLIEDWPDETPVIALEAKRWKGCLPAPYIAEMHNNLPRLLELAEAGLRVDPRSPAWKAELRARMEQIQALTEEKHGLEADLHRIVEALGIGARPYSGREAMDRDILPRIEWLRAVADAARRWKAVPAQEFWNEFTEAVRAFNEDEARNE